ncbi:MAG: hypothetical protein EP340_08755 [Alphaproteobacteria bacterium]|nr:MAG: hypothetical protein EP340_08755 [Alphaproteobacteria bacterium]
MIEKLNSKALKSIMLASTLFVVPSMSACAEEGGDVQVKIDRAMSAAPSDISAEATIVDADGTVLREGTNGWTCIPGVPLIPGDDHPMCNDAVWMKWLDAFANGKEFSTDVIGVSYMLQGDALVNNDNPAATDPSDGGMWVQDGPHLMMLFPSLDMIADLPRDPYVGGPYVMWDNTPMVHVMVPVVPKERK